MTHNTEFLKSLLNDLVEKQGGAVDYIVRDDWSDLSIKNKDKAIIARHVWRGFDITRAEIENRLYYEALIMFVEIGFVERDNQMKVFFSDNKYAPNPKTNSE